MQPKAHLLNPIIKYSEHLIHNNANIMVTIRCLVLSDTHDDAFPSSLPDDDVDVVLHCGDLTMIGGLSNYKKAITNINAIKAELKLVIAGNHDVSLDPKWWSENLDEDEDDDDLDEPVKAQELFHEEEANGLYLLSEGTHTFILADGRRFTIYASPYTPEFNGYAFAYAPEEDRFSGETAKNPIPEGVDIVMTHGPPLVQVQPGSQHDYQLDINRDGLHCGCPKLFDAIRRTQPQLHCFGHMHEGYGSQEIDWTSSSDSEAVSLGPCQEKKPLSCSKQGKTVLLNAAIMNHGGEEINEPWVIDVNVGI